MIPNPEAIKHCTTSLAEMMKQNSQFQTKEVYDSIMSRIYHYAQEYEAMEEKYGEHAGTVYLLTMLDNVMEKALNSSPKPQISCRKGCAHCCHQFVATSEQEAKLIYRFCKEENIPIDVDKLTRQKDYGDGIDWVTKEDTACVFLDENNTCKIYEARPASCRKYLVSSPPEQCDTKVNPQGRTIVFSTLELETVASTFPNLSENSENLSLAGQLFKIIKNETPTFSR